MVPNIKYYVVTVTSIFLALGIGIFMGFMLDAESLVSSQREDIVAELQKTFDEMKQDTENIRAEIGKIKEEKAALNDFLDDLLPISVSEKLVGYTIAMVEVNEDYIYTDLSDMLDKSGAEVSSKTVVKDSLFESEERIKEIYRDINGVDLDIDVWTLVSDEISNSIEFGESSPIIKALIEEGHVEVVGSYENMASTVLMAGGASSQDDKSKPLSQKIIASLKGKDLRIIGVERLEVEHSYIGQYKEERIASVDNVDTPMGKVSIVAVIRGENGNFGEREESPQLRPNLNILLQQD